MISDAPDTARETVTAEPQSIRPGNVWLDVDGVPIDAHGGGICTHQGVHYWYGEGKRLGHGNQIGVTCYRSTDLLRWQSCGVVLTADAFPTEFRAPGVCERPKVIYNERSGMFVMWMHLDSADYRRASAGVAIADAPTGPFRIVRVGRPLPYVGPAIEGDDKFRQREDGSTFRDMTLFVDRPGVTAYVIYAAEGNATLYASPLNDDYTWVAEPARAGETFSRIHPGWYREAPVIFRSGGFYYLITSGCTGWAPNAAVISRADSVLGPWTAIGNPFRGPGNGTTFDAQGTFAVAVDGRDDAFVFMADRWNERDIRQSTYVWLPITAKADTFVSGDFLKTWSLNVFRLGALPATPMNAPQLRAEADGGASIHWEAVAGAHGYRVLRNGQNIGSTTGRELAVPKQLHGRAAAYTVVPFRIDGPAGPPSPSVVVPGPTNADTGPTHLTDIEPDGNSQAWWPLGRNRSVCSPVLSVAGVTHPRGLGVGTPCELTYRLGSAYRKLEGACAVDDGSPGVLGMRFRVVCDGIVRFDSGVMVRGEPQREISVDVRSCDELRLAVETVNPGPSEHATWLNLRLTH